MVFPESEGVELISTHRVLEEIEDGATCFMIVAHREKENLRRTNQKHTSSIRVC